MTSYTWTGVSGDWNLASNWTPAGGPPTAVDTATINGSATDTVTVDTADDAYSLTLSDANATLNDDGPSASLTITGTLAMTDGTLNISPDADGGVLAVGALTLSGGALTINTGGLLILDGTLSQTGGTLTLNDGGAISGGTIDSTAGTLAFDGGTLSGVTFDGPLNLTAPLASVQLANGTTVVGSSGSGPGTINDTGAGDTLGFDNTQTVSSETINLGSISFDYLSENDTGAAGNQVLTLASSVTVDVQGSAIIYDSAYFGDGIVNEGAIDQTSAGQLDIEPTTFTNSGTIDAKATNGQLIIDPATFINSGTIDVANGEVAIIEPTTFTTTASSVIAIGANSSVTIEPTNSWTNLGSIRLASGASLYLYGPMSAASLGSVRDSGGTVYIAGTWNNSGQTLNGSASFGALALYGGTISGGTVTSAGVSFTNSGGTLSGVTFHGPLDLTASGASVALASGTTVVGSSGSGPGTINDTGEVAGLHFDNTQTFNNATINLGNADTYSYLEENDSTGSGTGFDPGVERHHRRERITRRSTAGGYSGDGIVNKGAIEQIGNQRLSLFRRQCPHQQRHDHRRFERRGADDRHHRLHQQRRDRHRQRRDGHHRADHLHDDGVERHRHRGEFVAHHRADQLLDQPRLDHAGRRRQPHVVVRHQPRPARRNRRNRNGRRHVEGYQYRNDRSLLRHARGHGGSDGQGDGHDLGRRDARIRRWRVERQDARQPGYWLQRRRA